MIEYPTIDKAGDFSERADSPAMRPAISVATRVLRYPEVVARTGLSRTSIWRREHEGNFPPRRDLGPNAVGWLQSEVEDWIAGRAVRRAQPRAVRSKAEGTGHGRGNRSNPPA